MIILVRLFAAARQLAGDESLEINLADGSLVSDLRTQLAAEFPTLAPLLPHVLFAIGSQYVDDEHPLHETEEIACIPPVSGG